MSACPPIEVLEHCLLGLVSAASDIRIRDHINQCSACQAILEELTREPELRRSTARRGFLDPIPSPRLAQLLDDLRGISGGIGPEAERVDSGHGLGQGSPATGHPVEGMETIGPFQITAELGRGGMGVVFKCYDPWLDRTVAIKVLPPWKRQADACERFEREARAVAQIDHPNVIPVHSVDRLEDGRPYFVMPYISGPTLAARMRSGPPLGYKELARLVLQVAEGLVAVHQVGLVHRDIKPENILLGQDGVPRVTDFSLVKCDTTETTVTPDGQLLGTPAYMSPEQARGEVHRVDARSDVYSLGVIVYQLLTGELPFGGGSRVLLHRILHDEPRPPRGLNDQIPKDLETICLKAMAKEPERRYATANALAVDLRHFLDGKPILARPVGGLERLWRWSRRQPALASAWATVVVLAILSFGFAMYELRTAKQLAREQTRSTEALREAERLSALLAFEHGLTLAEQGDESRGMLWFARSLEITPAGANDLQRVIRANLAAWRARLCVLKAVVPHDSNIVSAAFHPGGGLFVTGCQDGTARVWNARTGLPAGPTLKHQDEVTSIAFSRDGTIMVTGSHDHTARIWDWASGRMMAPPLDQGDPITAVCLSGDGRIVMTGGEDMRVKRWNAATGQLVGEPIFHPLGVKSVAFGPDEKTILCGCYDGTARLWDAATNRLLSTSMQHAAGVMAAVYSPDGRSILTGSEDATARLWDAATGAPVSLPFHHQNRVLSVAFSPDGRFILTGSQDQTVRLWDAASGRMREVSFRHLGPLTSVAFGPDGLGILIASEDRTARLWEITDLQSASAPIPHTSPVRAVAFSPDGQTIFTGTRDGLVQRFDTAAHRVVGPPLRNGSVVYSLAISPDGQTLIAACKDGNARLWNLVTDQPKGTPLRHGGAVYAVAYSPDGDTILTGSADKTARLWDSATGEPRGAPLAHDGAVYHVCFSPDNRLAATASEDRTARLWLTATGVPVGRPLPHGGWVESVAFSPDARTLLTGSQDSMIRIWDTVSQTLIGPPSQHGGLVESVAFSPDGRTFLTGSRDRTARLWDAATGRPIGPPMIHQDSVGAACFSPSGRLVLTGSQDCTARLWNVPPPLVGDRRQVTLRVQTLTGMAMRTDGVIDVLDAATWQRCRARLE